MPSHQDRNRAYYLAHKSDILAKQKARRLGPKRQEILEKKRAASPIHSERRRKKHGIRPMAQYLADVRTNPVQRLARKRAYSANFRLLRSKNPSRHDRLLGCSRPEFRAHLERLFQPGMSWQNYATLWELDHIKPLASFDLTDPAQFAAAAHFSNVRPRLCSENRLPNPQKISAL